VYSIRNHPRKHLKAEDMAFFKRRGRRLPKKEVEDDEPKAKAQK
jgi:hypothetical protein